MPVITCRDIGSIGRFGNQLSLYAHAKGYAIAMGCDFQCGDWIGRKIFTEAANDPVTAGRSIWLRQTIMDSARPDMLGYYFGQKDIDVKCYAMHQRFIDYYSRAQVKQWFSLKPEIELYNYADGGPYSAAHRRYGDYLKEPFCKLYAAITTDGYLKAIKQFNVPEPLVWIEEGSYYPLLQHTGIGAPWLTDFLILRDATHLLRANSSFSQWAGWLGNGKVYSPVVGSKVGWQDVEFVEGNHPCTAGIFRNQSELFLKES